MIMVGIIVIAFALDAIFGDPYCIPHPICLIGKLISKGEKALRKCFYGSEKKEYIGGMLLSVGVVLISFVVPAVILRDLVRSIGACRYCCRYGFAFRFLRQSP